MQDNIVINLDMSQEDFKNGKITGCVTCKDRAALTAWREHYLQLYPYQGYGTAISHPKLNSNQVWVISVFRYSMCS